MMRIKSLNDGVTVEKFASLEASKYYLKKHTKVKSDDLQTISKFVCSSRNVLYKDLIELMRFYQQIL